MNTSDRVKQYQEQFTTPENAESMIKTFWRVSEFPDDLLFSRLKKIANSEFEDDYDVFLKKQNLLKTGLALVGFESSSAIDKIEAIFKKSSEPWARIAAVADLSPRCKELYFKDRQQQECFSEEYFDLILSEVAILLVLSKNFLDRWSKSFSRIVETHPAPEISISNLLRLTMRGEALIADSNDLTHRKFGESSELFVNLMDEDKEDVALNEIWTTKRARIITALGRKK